MATASITTVHATGRTWRLAPRLPDLFFAVVLAALFARPYGWQALLGDGDTGWHIQTGAYILEHGSVPVRDPFSFSRPGQTWYAWEWLSDLIFAGLHRLWGLQGVAVLGAVLIALTAALLFAWLLWREAGAGISLAVTLAAASAASIHYLARPHLFSLLLMVVGLWMLDRDRRKSTAWLWSLVPMAVCWANLHAGFTAWLGTLGLLVLVSAAQRNGAATRRYGLLAVLSGLATLANPYGWQLHRHVFGYLASPWIAQHVEEFQSPRIGSENMWVFAVLLLTGVAVTARAWRRSQWFEGGLVLWWGFAALVSARHVPLFAIVAAPVIASYGAQRWKRWAERSAGRSAARLLWESSRELGLRSGFTCWMPILGALAVAAVLPSGLSDFPRRFFPVEAVSRNEVRLTSSAATRILTSDQWADYLIYRLYPRTRVFFDGRSDFYGESVGNDYQELLTAGRRAGEVIERYGFTAALLPLDWPLGQILERDPRWRVAYRDSQAVLLERTSEASQ